MKRYSLLVLLSIVLCLIISINAFAFEGFRGSTWGELRWDIPRHGNSDLLLDGWIRQGVDWVRWENTTLNTYATLRYKWDSEKFDWNNSIGPGVGIAIDTFTPKGFSASWGVEYLWDRFYESARTEHKVVLYMNWYGWWDLKKKP